MNNTIKNINNIIKLFNLDIVKMYLICRVLKLLFRWMVNKLWMAFLGNWVLMLIWMLICWIRWCIWSFIRRLWRSLLCILVAGIMLRLIILIIRPNMRSCFCKIGGRFLWLLAKLSATQLKIVRSLCHWSIRSSCN